MSTSTKGSSPTPPPGDALKRFVDVAAASVGLVVLAPVLVLIAAVILVRDGRPVLFVQERAGRFGRPFRMFKFRTMTVACPGEDRDRIEVACDDVRVTPVGAWLRRTSLDELPQLVNVVRGEMSLVGPRPALMSQAAEYGEFEAVRLQVRPGITGWAQVNGRNSLSWAERIELDRYYVEHHSLGLDARILARSVPLVASGAGVVREPGGTKGAR